MSDPSAAETTADSTTTNAASKPQRDPFVGALGCVLTHLISVSPDNGGDGSAPTVFHAIRVPTITIHEYLHRLLKYSGCSPECFVLCLVYIDRVLKQRTDFIICRMNVHRFVVASMLAAIKFFDDKYYSNAYYAKVGGTTCQEINTLEAQFLNLIEWRLYVSPEEFQLYRSNVLEAIKSTGTPCADPNCERSVQAASAACGAATTMPGVSTSLTGGPLAMQDMVPVPSCSYTVADSCDE